MSRNWWVRRLFAPRPRTARPAARPGLLRLEDRSVPANLITIEAGGLPDLPPGASDFTDTKDYVIAPSALAAALADVVFRANADIRFLSPAALAVGLDAESKAGVVIAADLLAAGKTVTLTAAGTVEQTAGVIAADKLVVTSTGGSVLLGDLDADRQVPPGTPTFFFNKVGQVSGSAAGDFTLTAGGPLTVAAPGVSAGGRVTLALASPFLLTVAGPVTAKAGNATLYADDMELTAPVSAKAAGTPDQPLVGNVQLFTTPVADVPRPITLGGTAADTLSLTQAELDLTAGRLVQIGDGGAGDLTVAGKVAAPPGFTRLVLASGGAITQAAGAGLTVAELAVAPLGKGPATLTDPANDVRVFAGLGGGPGGVDVRFRTKGDLTVGRVGLIAGITGNVVEVEAAGSLTVDAPNTKGTPAEPFSARGIGTDGPLVLRAGTDLTVAAGSKLDDGNKLVAGKGATLLVGQAQAVDGKPGGVLTLPPGALDGTAVTVVEGKAGADTFNVAPSKTSKISIDGKGPVLPEFPGDAINFTPTGKGLAITPAGDGGTLADAGDRQAVTFVGIESVAVLPATPEPGPGPVTVEGAADAADFVKLYRDAGTNLVFFQRSADNGATFGTKYKVSWAEFVFNGNGGKTGGKLDTLRVAYTGGDPLAELDNKLKAVLFNGKPGDGGLLSVQGNRTLAPKDARYLPDAKLTGNGTVTLTEPGTGKDARVITFTGLTPVDLFGLVTVTVNLPNANDVLDVANGFDFATGLKPALIVSGKSGDKDIETVAAWANTTLVIDTAAAPGVDGDDAVTVTSADNKHLNTNLTIATGTGKDAVAVNGPIVVSGSVSIQSVDITVTKDITAQTGTVTLNNSGTLTLGAVTVSGKTGVFQVGGKANTGTVLLKGSVTLAAANGPVDVGSPVAADPDGKHTLTLAAGVLPPPEPATPDAGTVRLRSSVGVGGRPAALAVTGSKIVLGQAVAAPGQAKYLTTGPQTYTGDVVLAADVAAEGSGLLFAGRVDGDGSFNPNRGLSVTVTDPTKAATFKGPVGLGGPGATPPFDLQALRELTVNGAGVFFGGTVRTVGGQTYKGPVTIAADTSFESVTAADYKQQGVGPIRFAGTLDSADAKGKFGAKVLTGGATSFDGKVGSGFALAFLTTDAGGTTVIGGELVTTTGPQTYGDPVTLAKSAKFVGLNPPPANPGDPPAGSVTFQSALDAAAAGEQGAEVASPGQTTFAGPVGKGFALKSLATDAAGTAAVIGGPVRTVGDQTFGDPVILGPDAKVVVRFETVTAADAKAVGTGKVTFNGTLEGPAAAVVITEGDTTFAKAVGVVPLAALTVNGGGKTFVNGGLVTTTGPQTYLDDVVLGKDTTFTATNPPPAVATDPPAGTVTFAALDAAAAGKQGATVNTPGGGATTFNGPVGGTKALAFLLTDAKGTTTVATATVTTTGPQTYLDPVTLAADVTFTATNPPPADPGDPPAGDVTFNSTLDSAGPVGGFGATVNTPGGGTTTFAGKVGGGTALAFLRTDAKGKTVVAGGLVSTHKTTPATGDQTFNDPVTATSDVTFQTVAADKTVPGTGAIQFLDAGPASLSAPGFAVVICTDGPVVFEGGVTAGRLLVECGGLIDLNGKTVTTTGEQVYAGDVVLTEDTTLAASQVTFGRRVDADLANNWTLAVNADAVFNGEVGGAQAAPIAGRQPLGKLTVAGAATVAGGLVRTVPQPGRAGADGSQFFAGPVTVGGRAVLFESLPAGGPITFNSTLDGAFDVTVRTAAATTFTGPVGGKAAPASLRTDGGGTTAVNGGAVTTTGPQTYADDVVLGATATFTATGPAGAVAFAGKLDAAAAGKQGATVNTPGGGATTFGGAVGTTKLAFLATAAPGTTAVNGGGVATTGPQTYGDPVTVGANTTFAAGGDVTFTGTLTGPFVVAVNSPATTTFGGPVSVGSLTTDAKGGTVVRGGAVTTAAEQTYGDPVAVAADATFASTGGGAITFADTLDGPAAAAVRTAGPTTFARAVGGGTRLASLFTDGGGTTFVNGGAVRTAGDQRFLDDVRIGADTAFDAGGVVLFGGRLDGQFAVTASSQVETRFGGPVDVGSLTTAGGKTVVAAATVTTAAGQRFGNSVSVVSGVTFTGAAVRFDQRLDDLELCLPVTVDTTGEGETRFGGPVDVGSLTTNADGRTVVAGGSVTTCTSQTYGDPVAVEAGTTFASRNRAAASSITFNRTLTGPSAVGVNTAADTVFNGAVDVGSLTTDAAGATRVNGGSVRTAAGQAFNDPVTLGKDAVFATGTDTAVGTGPIRFGRTLDGKGGATVTTAGDTTFTGAVGSGTPLGFLTVDGGGLTRISGGLVRTAGDQTYSDAVEVAGTPAALFVGNRITLASDFRAAAETGTLEFAAAAGVNQTGGAAVVANLRLTGGGTTQIDQPDNEFTTLVVQQGGGTVFLSDATALALSAEGVRLGGGGDVRIRTGTDFTADVDSVVDVSGGRFVVYPGLTKAARVVFTAPATAAAVVLGRPTSPPDDLPPGGLPDEPAGTPAFPLPENTKADSFRVRPSDKAPIFVFGNAPRPPLGSQAGDTLEPDLAGRAVVQFQYDGQDGFYDVAGLRRLTFSSIEGLAGLSRAAFVAQTGEPRDGTGATTQQYNVRAVLTQNGTPLPGGLNGARLPENPFVVSPALVNPAASTQPPRIAFGDFGGDRLDPTRPDNVPDLVLANGPGTPPLVTVIDGNALNPLLVYDDGRPVEDGARAVVDPDNPARFTVTQAGRPAARASLVAGNRISDFINLPADRAAQARTRFTVIGADGVVDTLEILTPILAQFYAYDPGFQGGVNVAVGRLAGAAGPATITTGADQGGGPHVRTFTLEPVAGKFTPLAPRQLGTSLGNFFAYEPSFTGGVRVAVADVTGDGADDLVLTPGAGGGPRVRVFDGQAFAARTDEITGSTVAYADFFTVEETFRGGLYVAAGFYRPDVPAEYGVRSDGEPAKRRADIVVGAGGGGGPRVMVFDGRGEGRRGFTGTAPPPVLANFFAFEPQEQNDPLFGQAGFFTGVGGVAFGGRGTNGFLDVLVSTARGPQLQVRRFVGGEGKLARADALALTDPDLTSLDGFAVSIPRLVSVADVKLDPDELNYGATVGGFVT